MPDRPAFLTAIGYFLLGSIVLVATATALAASGIGHSSLALRAPGWRLGLALTVGGMLVNGVAGLGALRGWNGSRFLYAAWTLGSKIPGLLLGGYRGRPAAAAGLVLGLLILAALFLPRANAWYRGRGSRV
jgi:hypothetical protein